MFFRVYYAGVVHLSIAEEYRLDKTCRGLIKNLPQPEGVMEGRDEGRKRGEIELQIPEGWS